jgi:hypothetical protein
MMYLGIVMLVVGVIAVLIGFLQKSKAKKILAAPFKKTGEIAANPSVADAKGRVSAEGNMVVPQPLTAPCTNTPVVYYEIEVERQWEKSVLTENGTKTERGWKTISTTKNGCAFQIDDGSGPVGIDARADVDCPGMQQSYKGPPPGGQGLGILADLVTSAIFSDDERTIGYRATEKIIPAQGRIFAMGKIAGGYITKEDGMMGHIMLSTKGRDGLVGSLNRNAMIGWILGGILTVGGIPVTIFGDAPTGGSSEMCASTFDGEQTKPCKGKIDDDSGQVFTWKVKKDGNYTVKVTQPNVKYPIYPEIILKNDDNKVVQKDQGVGKGEDATLSVKLEKGTYKLTVRDIQKGYAAQFKKGGGLSFWVEIKADEKKGDTKKAAKKADDDDDKKADKKADDDDKKADDKKADDDTDKKADKKADDEEK